MMSPLTAILISGEKAQRNVVEGRKKITIRKGHRNYLEGKIMLCSPETSFCVEANITSVRHCYAEDLTNEELRDDGYDSVDHLVEDFRKSFYPSFTRESETTVIRWDSVRGKLVR